MQVKFYGNKICCGSYACLNAMQDPDIDLQLFEISTGTPFGIRHEENGHFDRLLTTYADPNIGIDHAAFLWGYDTRRKDCAVPEEAAETARRWVNQNHAVVMGPVDMGYLSYNPLSSMQRRMDHYIVLKYWSEKEILCIDSEGFAGQRMDDRELAGCLSVAEVPEAGGKITLRCFRKRRQFSIEEIVKAASKQACSNLSHAENSGEGSEAIRCCKDYLKGQLPYSWKLPLAYDIQYLKQRKRLLQYLLELMEIYEIEKKDTLQRVGEIARIQQNLLDQIYIRTLQGEIDQEKFEWLGEWEARLAGTILQDHRRA